MVWSPGVPVFRDDSTLLLENRSPTTLTLTLVRRPSFVHMITSCAVNLGHFLEQGGGEEEARREMEARVGAVVRLAAEHGAQVRGGVLALNGNGESRKKKKKNSTLS